MLIELTQSQLDRVEEKIKQVVDSLSSSVLDAKDFSKYSFTPDYIESLSYRVKLSPQDFFKFEIYDKEIYISRRADGYYIHFFNFRPSFLNDVPRPYTWVQSRCYNDFDRCVCDYYYACKELLEFFMSKLNKSSGELF